MSLALRGTTLCAADAAAVAAMPPWSPSTTPWIFLTLFLLERVTSTEEVQCFVQGSEEEYSCQIYRLYNEDNCYKNLENNSMWKNLSYTTASTNTTLNGIITNVTIYYPQDRYIMLYTTNKTFWYVEHPMDENCTLNIVNLPSTIDEVQGVRGLPYPSLCPNDQCGYEPLTAVRPFLVSHTIEVQVITWKNCTLEIEFFSSNASMNCMFPNNPPVVETVDAFGNQTVTFENVYTSFHCFGIRINNMYQYTGRNVNMSVEMKVPTLKSSYHFDVLAILIVIICLTIMTVAVGMLCRYAKKRSLRAALTPDRSRRPLLVPPAAEALLLLYPRNSALLCAAVAALRARLDRALSLQVVDPFDQAVIEEVAERPQEWLAERLAAPSVRVLLLPPPATAAAAAAPANDFRLYACALRFLQENPAVGHDYTRVFFAGFSGMPFADNQMGLIVPLKRFILPGHLRELFSEIGRCPGEPRWRWEREIAALEQELEEARAQHRAAAAITDPSGPDAMKPLLNGCHSPEIKCDEKSGDLLICDLV